MMGRVMNHVVTKITQEETGKTGRGKPPKDKSEKGVENRGQRNTYHRWHNQPGRILRIVVVHSVHQEMESFSPGGFWLIMKNEPVHEVFNQSPNDQAGDDQTQDGT